MRKEKWNLVGKEENGCKSTRTELLHHLVLLFYLVNNVVQMVQYMIYIYCEVWHIKNFNL